MKRRLEDRHRHRRRHRRREQSRRESGGGDFNEGGGEEEEQWPTATADDIDELRSTAVVMEMKALDSGATSTTTSTSSAAARGPLFDDLGVDVDDLEGCTAAELNPKLVECTRMCARALEVGVTGLHFFTHFLLLVFLESTQ